MVACKHLPLSVKTQLLTLLYQLRQAEQELNAISTEWLSHYEDMPGSDNVEIPLRHRFAGSNEREVSFVGGLSDVSFASDAE